jgi:hypothetical protein
MRKILFYFLSVQEEKSKKGSRKRRIAGLSISVGNYVERKEQETKYKREDMTRKCRRKGSAAKGQ